MKHNRLFTLTACLLVLAACDKEKEYTVPGGLDATKPAVSSFEYNDAASGAKTAGFVWTADQAVAAGATSYTIELTQDISTDKVENGTSITIVNVPELSATVSKNIKAGEYYYARIRANYPGFFYSEWKYLGSGSNPLAVLVGTGAVEAIFSAPANLATKPTETSFKATWDKVPFATSYTFEYKAASSGDWSVVDGLTVTSYEVEGLVAQTKYDIRVKAVKGKESSEYTTGSVTTLEPSKFKPNMTTAEEFILFITEEAALASSGNNYTLEADIDLKGVTLPEVEAFKGTLDGKGHSIKNLASGKPIFTKLQGTVKDVVIDNSCKFAPEVAYFGVIAGTNEGKITGVTNKAAVTYNADAVSDPMLIAGIAAVSSGEISDCVNEGAISLTASGSVVGFGIAGIVGYQTGAVKGCTNRGAVGFSAKNVASKAAIFDTGNNVLPTPGGICAIGAPGFSIENCNNYGTVSYMVTGADVDLKANLNRNQIGGIAGAPCGMIMNCNNYGEVNVTIKNSTPGTALGFEFIACVGGIGGGDALFTNTTERFSNTSYINCVNEGNITVDSDASKSNSAIAGIVGWPGQEKPATGTSASGCVNKGNITCKGVMKCRAAGIEGGTGIVENCENQGIISVEGIDAASAIGSLCAFHSQGHAVTGSTAGGEVIVKTKVTGGVGALIGNIGNAAHSNVSGNKVNCKITVSTYDAGTMGLIIGKWNGKTQAITIGQPDAIQVSGSINGTNASADNMWGTTNYDPSMHVVNYIIK